jgi:hypothetical protein
MSNSDHSRLQADIGAAKALGAESTLGKTRRGLAVVTGSVSTHHFDYNQVDRGTLRNVLPCATGDLQRI